jgi:hypothetical protein
MQEDNDIKTFITRVCFLSTGSTEGFLECYISGKGNIKRKSILIFL